MQYWCTSKTTRHLPSFWIQEVLTPDGLGSSHPSKMNQLPQIPPADQLVLKIST